MRPQFHFRQQIRFNLVYSKLARDSLGDELGIARKQNCSDFQSFQLLDSLPRLGALSA
jgi:hypothetical protein